mgnify:CR=1 FL=1
MPAMTFNDVLLGLLAHLRAEHKAIFIDWDSVQKWPEGALNTLIQLGFLIPASATQSIECHACENRCFMDVITLVHADPALSRAFIVCDDADMQSQIGRVQIPLIRLQQWQCSIKQLAKVIADSLAFKDKLEFTANQSVIKLGMLKSDKGRRWVSLICADLSLEINQHIIAIDDVLYFEDDRLFIDQALIDDLLNREPLSQGKKYIPSTDRREIRKRETQAMYQDWKDEYLQLSKLHPTKSNTWISKQIAKMSIAKDKNSETIRKNMIK